MDRPPFQPPTSKLQAGIKVVFLLERLLFFQFIYYINMMIFPFFCTILRNIAYSLIRDLEILIQSIFYSHN